MSICWFCHWGWPEPIREIYDRAEAEIDALLPAPGPDNDWTDWRGEPTCGESALQYGPAHVVWADENFELAEACLKDCDAPPFAGWHPAALEVVRRSLRELMALPEEVKVSPEGYDGENPRDYPPTHGLRMVK